MSNFHADAAELSKAEARGAEFFSCHGVPQPRPQLGETLPHYRRRALSIAQSLLRAGHPWSRVDLGQQSDAALVGAEIGVFDSAVAEFKKPAGPLRMLTERDETGRMIRRFYGDPEQTWAPFKQQPRQARVNPTMGRGRDSVEGRQQQAHLAAALAIGLEALGAK